MLGVDGICDFDAPHSGRHNDEAQLCAFDMLIEGDDDLLPLSMRKVNLERLLARRPEGIFVNPLERGEVGLDLFDAACRMGLEDLISKRRDQPYPAGRSKGQGQEPQLSGDEPGGGDVISDDPCVNAVLQLRDCDTHQRQPSDAAVD